MKGEIHYIKHDATDPDLSVSRCGNAAIVHICNNIHVWGGGFTGALSRRWMAPEIDFRKTEPLLGTSFTTRVTNNIVVVGLFGQRGIRSYNNPHPIDYKAVEKALLGIGEFSINHSYWMPRIGCGLAGGTWEEMEPIIRRILVDKFRGDVYVCDL